MPLSTCTITGTAYYANGSLGDANVYITADQVTLNGSVIGTAAQDFYAEPVGGIITLILPRGSTARLKGTVRGFQDYVAVAIPDTPTATLEGLIPVTLPGALPQGLSTISSPTFDDLTLTGLLNGVKVYRALLTQVGMDAPIAVVLENSLGGTVVWGRADVGEYSGTLTGAFTADKTFLTVGSPLRNGGSTTVSHADIIRASANVLTINTRNIDVGGGATAVADDLLGGTPVQILVYP